MRFTSPRECCGAPGTGRPRRSIAKHLTVAALATAAALGTANQIGVIMADLLVCTMPFAKKLLGSRAACRELVSTGSTLSGPNVSDPNLSGPRLSDENSSGPNLSGPHSSGQVSTGHVPATPQPVSSATPGNAILLTPPASGPVIHKVTGQSTGARDDNAPAGVATAWDPRMIVADRTAAPPGAGRKCRRNDGPTFGFGGSGFSASDLRGVSLSLVTASEGRRAGRERVGGGSEGPPPFAAQRLPRFPRFRFRTKPTSGAGARAARRHLALERLTLSRMRDMDAHRQAGVTKAGRSLGQGKFNAAPGQRQDCRDGLEVGQDEAWHRYEWSTRRRGCPEAVDHVSRPWR